MQDFVSDDSPSDFIGLVGVHLHASGLLPNQLFNALGIGNTFTPFRRSKPAADA
ncbi:hypothetical protein DPMN_169261 [Dreissena polymorpha]|uniref:Uncharacterized protein n=1 Tax=Dreissena polymorpha TaxID=45954 RepID=A0A9D4F2A9_DREPO|nr:hypothetical protein DPMN_169261 [Dreissena polymorpha]